MHLVALVLDLVAANHILCLGFMHMRESDEHLQIWCIASLILSTPLKSEQCCNCLCPSNLSVGPCMHTSESDKHLLTYVHHGGHLFPPSPNSTPNHAAAALAHAVSQCREHTEAVELAECVRDVRPEVQAYSSLARRPSVLRTNRGEGRLVSKTTGPRRRGQHSTDTSHAH